MNADQLLQRADHFVGFYVHGTVDLVLTQQMICTLCPINASYSLIYRLKLPQQEVELLATRVIH